MYNFIFDNWIWAKTQLEILGGTDNIPILFLSELILGYDRTDVSTRQRVKVRDTRMNL